MNINDLKEILNIHSSVWISKGITQLEFKEKLLVEKDIDPLIVKEKYNNASITSTLTHTVVGYQLEFIYNKNVLHRCVISELVTAKHAQKFIDGKITEHQLVGIDNIRNLYQAFIQTLLAEGINYKINQYANLLETSGNMEQHLDLLYQERLDRKRIGSDPKATTHNTDIS